MFEIHILAMGCSKNLVKHLIPGFCVLIWAISSSAYPTLAQSEASTSVPATSKLPSNSPIRPATYDHSLRQWHAPSAPHLILSAPRPIQRVSPHSAPIPPESPHGDVFHDGVVHGHSASDPIATDPHRAAHQSLHQLKEGVREHLETPQPFLGKLHELTVPERASIPDASTVPRWKAPYAYGYFGAAGSRQWSRTNGYRDVYKRWTYR